MSALDEMVKEARDHALRGSDANALKDFVNGYLRKHEMDPTRLIIAHLRDHLGNAEDSYKIKRQRCPECLAEMRLAKGVRESGLAVPDSIGDEEYVCVDCLAAPPG